MLRKWVMEAMEKSVSKFNIRYWKAIKGFCLFACMFFFYVNISIYSPNRLTGDGILSKKQHLLAE